MRQAPSVRTARMWSSAALALGALYLLVAAGATTAPGPAARAENKYIGAGKCKNCHSSAESGNEYAAWEKMDHHKAWETLASDAAKAFGKERGIADPQKSDECLQCHVTAFGVDEKLIKKGFKVEEGVQCESCHGPGENHMKARFAAAATEGAVNKVEPGEIVSFPPQTTCVGCHNEKSPSFKKFCYWEAVGKIRHGPPGMELPPEFKCPCTGDKHTCTDKCPGHEKVAAETAKVATEAAAKKD
jgi:Cytochrome c554 and c-prime